MCFNYFLTEKGQVFVCGQNHRGQLALGSNVDISTFHLCLSLDQTVTHVACGWDFTLFLTGERHFRPESHTVYYAAFHYNSELGSRGGEVPPSFRVKIPTPGGRSSCNFRLGSVV